MFPEHEKMQTSLGFWGVMLGLDYYHSKNQFINIGFSGVMDFFLPVPAAVDLSGESILMKSRYVSLSNNHKFKRLSVGYGLSYAVNTCDFRYIDRFEPLPPTRDPVKRSHSALGLVFPVYYQFGDYFNLGIIYRPTFYRPTLMNKLKYEHLISMDFALKIPLSK